MKNKLDFSKKPLLMGIFNFSDDSLYKYSVYNTDNIKNLENLIEKCDIIDIGAESTRPFSTPIDYKKEIELLKPALDLFGNFNKPISVDTYKSQTAEFAIENGADIINDISGSLLDKNMLNIISENDIYYIIGHIQHNPETMQINPKYNNIISDITKHFRNNIRKLTEKGFDRNNIIIDPCIGFGKNQEHNIEILKNISKFKKLNLPILIGTSRKSIHRSMAEINSDSDMFLATAVTNIFSVIKGADIIRVHDIYEFDIILSVLKYLI